MKKSTRALLGLVGLDAALALGTLWMVVQVRTGAWRTFNEGEAIATITSTMGGAIGVVTALLLVAFVVHKRRGN